MSTPLERQIQSTHTGTWAFGLIACGVAFVATASFASQLLSPSMLASICESLGLEIPLANRIIEWFHSDLSVHVIKPGDTSIMVTAQRAAFMYPIGLGFLALGIRGSLLVRMMTIAFFAVMVFLGSLVVPVTYHALYLTGSNAAIIRACIVFSLTALPMCAFYKCVSLAIASITPWFSSEYDSIVVQVSEFLSTHIGSQYYGLRVLLALVTWVPLFFLSHCIMEQALAPNVEIYWQQIAGDECRPGHMASVVPAVLVQSVLFALATLVPAMFWRLGRITLGIVLGCSHFMLHFFFHLLTPRMPLESLAWFLGIELATSMCYGLLVTRLCVVDQWYIPIESDEQQQAEWETQHARPPSVFGDDDEDDRAAQRQLLKKQQRAATAATNTSSSGAKKRKGK